MFWGTPNLLDIGQKNASEPATLGYVRMGRGRRRSCMTAQTRYQGWIAQNAADVAARTAVAVLFLALAYRVGLNVLETARLSGLLFLVNELLVVVFTLTRRFASKVDRSVLARVATMLATLGPLAARPDANFILFAESVVLPLSLIGVGIVVFGKFSLGRSFGLLPAHRGIVSSGVYGLVRHPIYLGCVLTHASFLLANASPWNAVVLVLADFALIIRMDAEERVLLGDDAYRQYRQTVRHRLIPGVY
jgi:protein-S-isoprenylcysteine O-methyltransferase Ste14